MVAKMDNKQRLGYIRKKMKKRIEKIDDNFLKVKGISPR